MSMFVIECYNLSHISLLSFPYPHFGHSCNIYFVEKREEKRPRQSLGLLYFIMCSNIVFYGNLHCPCFSSGVIVLP